MILYLDARCVLRVTRRACLSALCLSWIAFPDGAAAWGDEGHRLVGVIAEHELKPATRRRVDALLATDHSGLTETTSLPDETLWADRLRDSDRDTTQVHYRATFRWHFVNLEIDRPDLPAACFHGAHATDPGHATGDAHATARVHMPDEPHAAVPPRAAPLASAGPAESCIVDKIEQFRRELARADTPPAERLAALQYLAHLVGDLHQPLHASDRHDRGGNGIVTRLESDARSNLHADWDTALVRRLGDSEASVAQSLIAGITPAHRRAWRRGTSLDWARESFALGRDHVYARLPTPDADGVYTLDDRYVADALPVMRVQLQRAGVRLAALIEAALAVHP